MERIPFRLLAGPAQRMGGRRQRRMETRNATRLRTKKRLRSVKRPRAKGTTRQGSTDPPCKVFELVDEAATSAFLDQTRSRNRWRFCTCGLLSSDMHLGKATIESGTFPEIVFFSDWSSHAMPEIHKKSKRQWTDLHSQYKATEILGQGTYGVVYRGERRTHDGEGSTPVALKRSRLDVYAENGLPETALREVTLLHDLKHENILRLHNISCNTSRLYMVCEYLDMDLKKYIRSKSRAVSYGATKRIVYEVLKGVAFCHGNRVIHRDLKPHNILLNEEATRIKLADFGLARPKHGAGKTLTHEVVTLWYRAPELLLGHCNYDDSVDMWSVGCILAELLSGQPLFPGDSEIDTLFKIFRLLGTPSEEDWPLYAVESLSAFPNLKGQSDPFGKLNPQFDEDGQELLTRMLRYNPKCRIAAHEALEHAWFRDVRTAGPPAMLSKVEGGNATGDEGRDRRNAPGSKPRASFRIKRTALASASSVPSTLRSAGESIGMSSTPQDTCSLRQDGDDTDMPLISGSTSDSSCRGEGNTGSEESRGGSQRTSTKRSSISLEYSDLHGGDEAVGPSRNLKRPGGVMASRNSSWDWSIRSERTEADKENVPLASGAPRQQRGGLPDVPGPSASVFSQWRQTEQRGDHRAGARKSGFVSSRFVAPPAQRALVASPHGEGRGALQRVHHRHPVLKGGSLGERR
eukprot:Polyplicarium_translucidae@DN3089_c0_g2_i3.p1